MYVCFISSNIFYAVWSSGIKLIKHYYTTNNEVHISSQREFEVKTIYTS